MTITIWILVCIFCFMAGFFTTALFVAAQEIKKTVCPGCGKHFPTECDWCSEDFSRPEQ